MIRIKFTPKILFCIFCISAFTLQAREIHISLSQYPDAPYMLMGNRGVGMDTITTGILDKEGKNVVKFPPFYENYIGIGTFILDNDHFIEMILADENLSVVSDDKNFNMENVIFNNSPENVFLVNHFKAKTSNSVKINALSSLLPLYDANDSFYKSLKMEYDHAVNADSLSNIELRESSLYAARFIEVSEMTNLVYNYRALPPQQAKEVKNYLVNQMDYDMLYTSSLWKYILSGWANMYTGNKLETQDNFTQDALNIFVRIHEPDVLSDFANDAVTICESKGWDEAKIKMAYGVYQSGLLPNPEGNIGRLIKGMGFFSQRKVPDIHLGDGLMMSSLQSPYYYVIFYESGCENCDREIHQLKRNQKLLESKGYTIVSVSADISPDVDESTRRFIGWQHKLCDYKGYDGENFENYGILGTPTIYVLDTDLNIVGRYTRLDQTGILDS